MNRDFSRLLNPKSIAVFGGGWAETVIFQLKKSGFNGNIWPVHPKRETMCGIACWKNLSDLPTAPDASFIGVNRDLTIGVVTALANMGAGGAICFASGFLESDAENSGGADLQARLVNAAGNMPILGPNCYGLLNYLDGVTLWPDQHGGRACDRSVAIIGQSSNILVNMTMQKRALPIAYTIAVGNQAQTSLSDLAIATIRDDRVTVVGLYIEGFGDIRAFEEMASKARELNKPVVAIKSGKSEMARAATLTHTASLAGTSAASSAFLSRLGIVEVSSIAVFLEVLKLLHCFGPISGNTISSMTCSGGEAGLMADLMEDGSAGFRALSPHATLKLKTILGPLVRISNPLDYHTFIWTDPAKLQATYSAVFGDGYDLNILVMDIPPSARCDWSAWQAPLEAAIAAKHTTGANVCLLATLPENLSEEISNRLLSEGIVPLHGMEEMVAAVDATIRAANIRKPAPAQAMLSPPGQCEGGGEHIPDEARSKAELSAHGLVFPHSVVSNTCDEIAASSQALDFPVALKGLGIAHKSEVGAVKLNLDSPDKVRQAASAMTGTSGFLAEEMVEGAIAELLIGVTRDVTGLYVLTIGAGGALTELLDDAVSLIVPATSDDIDTALAGLKINRLLEGYRGKPRADRHSVLDAIEAVQSYCLANPHLLELDVNPLMALPDRAIAVDALIKLETSDG